MHNNHNVNYRDTVTRSYCLTVFVLMHRLTVSPLHGHTVNKASLSPLVPVCSYAPPTFHPTPIPPRFRPPGTFLAYSCAPASAFSLSRFSCPGPACAGDPPEYSLLYALAYGSASLVRSSPQLHSIMIELARILLTTFQGLLWSDLSAVVRVNLTIGRLHLQYHRKTVVLYFIMIQLCRPSHLSVTDL